MAHTLATRRRPPSCKACKARKHGGGKTRSPSAARLFLGPLQPPHRRAARLRVRESLCCRKRIMSTAGCTTACQQCRAELCGTANKTVSGVNFKLSARLTRTVPGCNHLEPSDPRQCAPSSSGRGKQNFVRQLRPQYRAEWSTTTAPRPSILTVIAAAGGSSDRGNAHSQPQRAATIQTRCDDCTHPRG